MLAATVVAAAWLFGTALVVRDASLAVPVRVAIGLTPLAPIAWLARLKLRWIRSLDELQQRIMVEALAISFAGTFVGLFLLDLFVSTGILGEWPGMAEMFGFMVLAFGIAHATVTRRYR